MPWIRHLRTRSRPAMGLRRWIGLFVIFHALGPWIPRALAATPEPPGFDPNDPARSYLTETSNLKSRIRGLKWDDQELDLTRTDQKGRVKYLAELRGRFNRPEWTLLVGHVIAHPSSSSGDFAVHLPVDRNVTPIRVIAVSDDGEIETEWIAVHCPRLNDLQAGRASMPHSWEFRGSIGPGFASYRQTNEPNVSETVIQAWLSVLRKFQNSPWRIQADAAGTAFALANGGSPALGVYHLEGAAGYAFRIGSRWELTLGAGAYYTTSDSTADLGFRNMAGPELTPSVTWSLENGREITADLRLAAVAASKGLWSPEQNQEAGLKLRYGPFTAWRIARLGVFMDVSELSLRIGSLEGVYQQGTMGADFSF